MTFARDPLLGLANLLLVLIIAVLGFAAAALALGGPAALLLQDRIVAAIEARGVTDAAQIFPGLGLVLLAIAGLLALAVYFLVLLRRIVRSVGEGDPFAPVNAVRLARMGWTALIGQLAAVPVGGAVYWIAKLVADDRPVRIEDDFGLSLGGILLVLILFILARVFRQGAAMREELEGTV